MIKQLKQRGSLLMAVWGALLFLPFLGLVPLFDWDEINFAEAAREMLATGDWLRMQIDFKPFWEKPPLFIWLQALSMQLLGVGEYAARLPNALTGIASLVVLYNMGTLVFDRRFGLLWALSYSAALIPHIYFKSGIIDPLFNLFIFLGLWYFILYYWRLKGYSQPRLRYSPRVYMLLAGVFAGLAVLTKGQVALVLIGATVFVFWLIRNQSLVFWRKGGKVHSLLNYDLAQLRTFFPLWHLVFAVLSCLLVMFFWYGIEVLQNGWWFIEQFIVYQIRLLQTGDAGHSGFPGYHFVMVFFLCFPASILALRSFAPHQAREPHQQNFKKWMHILFWVVMILFSLVKTKIIHYSSMSYFPLTFLSAYTIHQVWQGRMKWRRWQTRWLMGMGLFIALLLLALPAIAPSLPTWADALSTDPFAVASIKAEVAWHWYHFVPGLLLVGVLVFFYIKRKQGRKVPAFLGLLVGLSLFTFLLGTTFLPTIERYSQGAAIDFYKERQGEKAYVMTLGFKSYAHLYYSQLSRPDNPAYYKQQTSFGEHMKYLREWLAGGQEVDRTVYMVAKVKDRHNIPKWFPELQLMYEKNGFLFYYRPLPGQPQGGNE